MKTLNLIFNQNQPKELMTKVALCTFLSIGSYYQYQKVESKYSKGSFQLENIYNNQYGEYDKVQVSGSAPSIQHMISILRPELTLEFKENLAEKISMALQGTKIPPQVVVSIIDTESLFDQSVVSSTGDLSLAQINPLIWNKEFIRRGLEPMDVERLKSDHDYSLAKMVQILTLLKNRYEKLDRRWYARYHSQSKKFKRIYLAKLELRMRLLEQHHKNKLNKKESRHLVALQ